jgi:glucosaminylphosphatidylinositol acyltransferase
MDSGVGAFIFSLALTSPAARGSSTSGRDGLRGALRAVLPLLALGCARLVTVSAADYQVHVSEYGVHWNFFFTIAAVALCSALAQRLLPSSTSAYVGAGVAVLVAYQWALRSGLEHWIVTADRTTGLLASNKEGVTSAVGYLALYLIAVAVGRTLHSALDDNVTGTRDGPDWQARVLSAARRLWVRLAFATVALWCVAWACTAWVSGAPSRKMVNASYVAVTVALNCLLLTCYLAAGLVLARPHVNRSPVLDAVNYNSLAVFLVANLMTGAVNLSIRTLFVPFATALLIVRATTPRHRLLCSSATFISTNH